MLLFVVVGDCACFLLVEMRCWCFLYAVDFCDMLLLVAGVVRSCKWLLHVAVVFLLVFFVVVFVYRCCCVCVSLLFVCCSFVVVDSLLRSLSLFRVAYCSCELLALCVV